MFDELIGIKAIMRQNKKNKILCSEQGLNITEMVGYIEKINGDFFVNVNGNRLAMDEFRWWGFDHTAKRQYSNGAKVKLMDAPINQIICESIDNPDLIGFEGEIQYLENSDVKHGYYVVGDKFIIYMRDFPCWEFI